MDKITTQTSDEDLVLKTLENQDFFSYIIDRYQGKLLNYILRISNFHINDAEDILQDIFIKVYRNLNDFDQNLKFSSWIYRIAHNQVISQFRRAKARPEIVLDLENDILNNIADDIDFGKNIDRDILSQKISQVLQELDAKYRNVLILKFIEEKSYQEISDIIKKPMGSVATLINRAKKQLKRKLETNLESYV